MVYRHDNYSSEDAITDLTKFNDQFTRYRDNKNIKSFVMQFNSDLGASASSLSDVLHQIAYRIEILKNPSNEFDKLEQEKINKQLSEFEGHIKNLEDTRKNLPIIQRIEDYMSGEGARIDTEIRNINLTLNPKIITPQQLEGMKRAGAQVKEQFERSSRGGAGPVGTTHKAGASPSGSLEESVKNISSELSEKQKKEANELADISKRMAEVLEKRQEEDAKALQRRPESTANSSSVSPPSAEGLPADAPNSPPKAELAQGMEEILAQIKQQEAKEAVAKGQVIAEKAKGHGSSSESVRQPIDPSLEKELDEEGLRILAKDMDDLFNQTL